LTQPFQFGDGGVVLPLLHARLFSRRATEQADQDKTLADIDAGTSLQDYFHSRVSFWSGQRIKNEFAPRAQTANRGVPSRQLDQFRLRSFRHQYLARSLLQRHLIAFSPLLSGTGVPVFRHG
jgi:hypothetical protein